MRLSRLWKYVTIAVQDHWQEGIPDRIFVESDVFNLPDHSSNNLIPIIQRIARELGFTVVIETQPNEIIIKIT